MSLPMAVPVLPIALDKTPRPYVRPEIRPVVDSDASAQAGQTVYKNEIWVIIQAPGAKDTVEKKADDWLTALEDHARNDRVPRNWPAEYREGIEQWKKTQEMPEFGTPIKSWPPLSPAQRKSVLDANIVTVEDLAAANHSTLGRIGMGGMMLKQMAEKWVAEAGNTGVMMKALEQEKLNNAELQRKLTTLQEEMAEMRTLLPKKETASA